MASGAQDGLGKTKTSGENGVALGKINLLARA
jgi:hypothetical protein